jgi:hypothetical protein
MFHTLLTAMPRGCSLVFSFFLTRSTNRLACLNRGINLLLDSWGGGLRRELILSAEAVAESKRPHPNCGCDRNKLVPVDRCQGTQCGEMAEEVSEEYLYEVISDKMIQVGYVYSAVSIKLTSSREEGERRRRVKREALLK